MEIRTLLGPETGAVRHSAGFLDGCRCRHAATLRQGVAFGAFSSERLTEWVRQYMLAVDLSRFNNSNSQRITE